MTTTSVSSHPLVTPSALSSSPSSNLSSSPSRGFTTYTKEDAPAASRAFLAGTAHQLGFVPVAMGRWAESPAVLQAFFHGLELFDKTSLSPLEREVVVMTVALENDCHLCQAMHTARLLAGTSRATVLALREGAPTGDARLDALTAFARDVLRRKGDVTAPVWEAFLTAGFSRTQAMEVVLGVANTSLSTFANRLVEAPVDAAFAAYAPHATP